MDPSVLLVKLGCKEINRRTLTGEWQARARGIAPWASPPSTGGGGGGSSGGHVVRLLHALWLEILRVTQHKPLTRARDGDICAV